MSDELTYTIDPAFKCCSHCKSDKLGCNPKDPGHSMPCAASNCRTGKVLL